VGRHECFEVCFTKPGGDAVDAVALVFTAFADCILLLCLGQMTVGVAVAASSSIVRVCSSCLVLCLVLYGLLRGWAVAVLLPQGPRAGRPVGTARNPCGMLLSQHYCMVIMIEKIQSVGCYKRHCS